MIDNFANNVNGLNLRSSDRNDANGHREVRDSRDERATWLKLRYIAPKLREDGLH